MNDRLVKSSSGSPYQPLCSSSEPSRPAEAVPPQALNPPVVAVHLIAFWDFGRTISLPSMGIAFLAGHLRGQFGGCVQVQMHEVKSSDDIPKILDAISFGPKTVLGFSILNKSTESFLQFKDAYLRRLAEGHVVYNTLLHVFGGQLPTYFPQDYLCLPSSVVVMRAGEAPLEALVAAFREGTFEEMLSRGAMAVIPNLVYRDAGNRIHRTTYHGYGAADFVHPPAMDLVPDRATHAHVITAQGCDARCSFCTRIYWYGHGWQGIPLEIVRAQIESLAAKRVGNIEFSDDDFLGNVGDAYLNRARKILAIIREAQAKYDAPFSFRITLGAHHVYVAGRDTINAEVKALLLEMKQHGLTQITFGLESLSGSQMQRYGKKASVQDSLMALKILVEEVGLATYSGFIMFDPDLSLEELEENIKNFATHRVYLHNSWVTRPMELNFHTAYFERMKRSERLLPATSCDLCSQSYRFQHPEVLTVLEAYNRIISRGYIGLLYDVNETIKYLPDGPGRDTLRSYMNVYSLLCLLHLYFSLVDQRHGLTRSNVCYGVQAANFVRRGLLRITRILRQVALHRKLKTISLVKINAEIEHCDKDKSIDRSFYARIPQPERNTARSLISILSAEFAALVLAAHRGT